MRIAGCVFLVMQFLLSGRVFSQSRDSISLPLSAFYKQVAATHPLMKQAALLYPSALASVLSARGGFDPVLEGKWSQKELNEKVYYNQLATKLTVPLWFGADIRAGFEKASGDYLDPSDLTPENGLPALGISLPLGQGLLIDERRTALRQAKVLLKLAEADRVKMLNKFWVTVTSDFGNWYASRQKYNIAQTGFALANDRFLAVCERVRMGDLAPLDSVEAKIEMLNRSVILVQARQDWINSRLAVSNHFWNSDGEPLELDSMVIPVLDAPAIFRMPPADSLSKLLDFASVNHPDLLKLQAELDRTGLDRLLAREKLKPKLNMDYQLLGKGYANLDPSQYDNTYRVGMSFSMPLYLRQERGKLRQINFKITDYSLRKNQAAVEVKYRIQSLWSEMSTVLRQLEIQRDLVVQADLLRNGEQKRFDNGESSFFLVNVRETGLLSQRVKLADMEVKMLKAGVYFAASTGKLIF